VTSGALRPTAVSLTLAACALASAPALAQVLPFSWPEGTAAPRTEPLQLALGLVATIEFLLLVFLLGPRTWRGVGPQLATDGRGPTHAELLALLALTGGAFLLRVLVAEPAAILSTLNDVKHAHDAMCLSGSAQACELTFSYPLAVTAVHALVFRIVGPSLAATCWTNAVLGSLAVPALWLAATLLLRGRRAVGWFAAAALTGLPLHIRFAASGALTTGLVTFATLALAALLLFARTGRPRHLWLGALALALAIQARFEGVAFGLPLLLATLVAAPGFWRAALARHARVHLALAGILLLATAALPLWHVVQPEVSTGASRTGGLELQPQLALALGLPLAWLALGAGLDRLRWSHVLRWPVGLALLGTALALADHLGMLPRTLLPSPDPWLPFKPDGVLVPSFADIGFPLLNPRSVTLPAMALGMLAVIGGLHRERRGPVAVLLLWWGLASALGMRKFTGEIPFQYMRTAVDGVPAVALLAGIGAFTLRERLGGCGQRSKTAATALLAAFLLSGPLFSLPLLRAEGFDNQRQIAFLERTIPRLPEPAVVVFPDATLPGQMGFAKLFRIPEAWWTLGHLQGDREERFLGASAALESPEALLALAGEGWTLLWWEGLDCYRTAGAPGERRPDCDQMRWMFRLTPLAEETIPVWPFDSDFTQHYLITTREITLRVYRIDGLRR